MRFTSDGSVEFNGGPAHGLAALVGSGQLLLFFHHRGDSHQAVPHLMRPVLAGGTAVAWRAHDNTGVLVLDAPLAPRAASSLHSGNQKHGLWFVPGRDPVRAELAPGGMVVIGTGMAWWGMTHADAHAAIAAQDSLLVLVLPTTYGNEPAVLRQLSPGIWRCSDSRRVFVEDGAQAPRLQPSDMPRFVPRERLAQGILWLHPGRAAQTLSLTLDGRVAWSEVGGRCSGPANGNWERVQDDRGEYIVVNFHAFGDQARLTSTVLERLAGEGAPVWHAVGSVSAAGLWHLCPADERRGWHVLAVFAELPLKRPAM